MPKDLITTQGLSRFLPAKITPISGPGSTKIPGKGPKRGKPAGKGTRGLKPKK